MAKHIFLMEGEEDVMILHLSRGMPLPYNATQASVDQATRLSSKMEIDSRYKKLRQAGANRERSVPWASDGSILKPLLLRRYLMVYVTKKDLLVFIPEKNLDI